MENLEEEDRLPPDQLYTARLARLTLRIHRFPAEIEMQPESDIIALLAVMELEAAHKRKP